jgi:hypothetical protein
MTIMETPAVGVLGAVAVVAALVAVAAADEFVVIGTPPSLVG